MNFGISFLHCQSIADYRDKIKMASIENIKISIAAGERILADRRAGNRTKCGIHIMDIQTELHAELRARTQKELSK